MGRQRSTRLHDNPLFTPAGSDFLDFEQDDVKENWRFSPETTDNIRKENSSMEKAPGRAKRVLGERNFEDDPFGAQLMPELMEPPKSIRALSFHYQTEDDENSLSSLSPTTVSASSSPRFPESPSLSPTASSTVSSDSLEENAYDPQQNLRTPRPMFLRYRPDWRFHLMSSLDFSDIEQQSKQCGDDINKLSEETEGTEEDRVIDENKRSSSSLEDATARQQDSVVTAEAEDAGLVEQGLKQANTQAVQVKTKQQRSAGWVSLLVLLTFGFFVAGWVYRDEIKLAVNRGFLPQKISNLGAEESDVFDWDWFDEYDFWDYFQNGTQLPFLVETGSDELNGLLTAIRSGTQKDIEERYSMFMEYDEGRVESFLDEFYEQESGHKGGILVAEQAAFGDTASGDTVVAMESNAQVPTDEAADVEAEDVEAADVEAEDVEAGDVEAASAPISVASDAAMEDQALLTLPSVSEVTMFATAVLTLQGTIWIFKHLRKRWRTSSKKPKPMIREPSRPARTVLPRESATEQLVIDEDHTPYGSFTAYKVVPSKKNEEASLTPVRRSSRIRSQLDSQRTAPVARRALLS